MILRVSPCKITDAAITQFAKTIDRPQASMHPNACFCTTVEHDRAMPWSAGQNVEEAASEQARLFESVFLSLNIHVTVLDARGVITYMSSSWEEFAGAENGWFESALDAGGAEAAKDPLARKCLDGIQAVASGNLPTFSLEYPCYSPTERWFAMRVDPTPGKPGGVVVSHREVRQSHSRQYESLVQSIDGIVWELTLPSWKFTFVSRQSERILGFTPERWVEDPNFWSDQLYPDDREAAISFRATAAGSGEDYQLEYRMIAADGHIVWLRDIVTVETSDGRPIRLRGVMVDVTEGKRAEDERERLLSELELGRARLEMVLRQMPGGVMIAEAPTGKLLMANEGLQRIWRHEFVDLKTTEDYSGYYIDGRECEPEERPVARSITRGEIVKDEEYGILRGDGTRGIVSVNSAPIRDSNGNIIAAVVVFSDITEGKNEQSFHAGQKRVLEMIAADAPLPEVLTSILHLIELQSNGMLCSILLLDADGLHVRHGAAPSLPEAYIRAVDGAPIGPKAGSCGTAMYRAQPVIVTDILNDPLWEDYRGLAQTFRLGACWSTPIMSPKAKVLGSFAMVLPRTEKP